MAAAHRILSLNDQALVAYVSQRVSGANVQPGKSSDDKALPVIICWSERGIEDPPQSGIYTITAHVQVRTLAALDLNQDPKAPKDKSDQLIGSVFDLFHQANDAAFVDTSGEDLANFINAAANVAGVSPYTCQYARVLAVTAGYDDQHGRMMKGSCWVDSLELEMVVSPADGL